MPRIKFREMILGLSMYIYFEDHGHPHVEIYKGDPKNYEAKLKVVIGTWEVLECRGFREHVINRVVRHLRPMEHELMEAWNEIAKK